MKPSKRPFQAQNEGSSIATLLLVFLCTALLQSVDVLIALATLLFERQLLGFSSIGIAVSLLFALMCAPWLRLLWYLGTTLLCKRFFVGSFSEERPVKLGSRAVRGREIFDLVLSILGGVAELLKGSTIYNAMQRALGAKVGPGVCWLGRQHVEMAHPILRTGHRGSF
tara:strand:- start:324 stop:827 length:504 start_codon:yes stop_codon:yes gene_type:complete